MLPMQPQLDIEASTLATQPVNSSSSDFSSLFHVQRLPTGPVVKIHWGYAAEDVLQDQKINASFTFLMSNVVSLCVAPACYLLKYQETRWDSFGFTIVCHTPIFPSPMSVFWKTIFLMLTLMKDLALDTHIPQ